MRHIIINYSHNYRKQINILNLLCFRIGLGRPQWQQAAASADEKSLRKNIKNKFPTRINKHTNFGATGGQIGDSEGQWACWILRY